MKQKTSEKSERNAYSLIRFSTDKQVWGDSLKRQTERCRTECLHRGWQFDEKLCLTDLGVSAFRGNNFQRKFALGKFIEAAEQGKLLPNPVLIIENLDRFSRDILDNADSELWRLVKRGVDVLILSNGLHLTKGDENRVEKRAIIMFEFDRAHKESERKSDIISAAFNSKYLNAENGLAVSMGNWMPRWVDFNGASKAVGTFRLNDTANLIKDIVTWYLDGDSMLHIASRLNKGKVKPIGRGKRWTQGQVHHILTTETLIGDTTIKGKRFAKYYPPVIDEPTWNVLQAKLRQNKSRKGGGREGEYIANLFRNRVRCAHCGGSVSTQMSNKGRVKYYYKCQDARYGKCEVRSMVPVYKIELDFFTFCLQSMPASLLGDDNQKEMGEMAASTKRLSDLDRKFKDAKELIGVLPIAELKVMLMDIETERQTERERLNTISRKITANSSVPSAFGNLKELLAAGYSLSPQLGAAFDEVSRQLEDGKMRGKLLAIIPSLLDHITIDFQQDQYCVTWLNGKDSERRKLY